jgi:hypothetical protein
LIPSLSSLEYLRSLSFGGLISAGVAALIYFHYFDFFAPHITSIVFITFFGLLGAGLQNVIQRILGVVSPSVGRVIGFYENLAEVTALHRVGLISEARYEELIAKIVEKRFLGESTRQLPPGP